VVRAIYDAAARFHALPNDEKMKIRIDKHNVGYLPMKGDTLRTSVVQTVTRPNLNEAFFVARDLGPDHPDVVADRRFRSANQWPVLPGFRETVMGYCDALEALVKNSEGADYASLNYLVKTNEIVYSPSASVIVAIRQGSGSASAGKSMLLIADPVSTLWFNTLGTEPAALLGAPRPSLRAMPSSARAA